MILKDADKRNSVILKNIFNNVIRLHFLGEKINTQKPFFSFNQKLRKFKHMQRTFKYTFSIDNYIAYVILKKKIC